jgi:Holliday junction resolvase
MEIFISAKKRMEIDTVSNWSRRKGKEGELEVCKILKEAGIEAYRTQQSRADPSAPDITVTRFPGVEQYMVIRKEVRDLWPEVKWRKQCAIRQWVEEALENCGKKMPLVIHRGDRERWLLTVDLRLALGLDKVEDVRRGKEG